LNEDVCEQADRRRHGEKINALKRGEGAAK
jgi:hypothetical protein